MGPGAQMHKIWIHLGLTPSQKTHTGKEMRKSESELLGHTVTSAYNKSLGRAV